MLTRGQSPLPSILELPRHLGFIYPLIVRTSDFRVGEEFDLFSRDWIVTMNGSRFESGDRFRDISLRTSDLSTFGSILDDFEEIGSRRALITLTSRFNEERD